MTAKAKTINWPVAAIIIVIIGTGATLFGPLIQGEAMPIVSSDIEKSIEKLIENVEAFKKETREKIIQIQRYNREDFAYIKDELREIKRRLRK